MFVCEECGYRFDPCERGSEQCPMCGSLKTAPVEYDDDDEFNGRSA